MEPEEQNSKNNVNNGNNEQLTSIEAELLDEYRDISNNLNKLSEAIARINDIPTPKVLASLQQLESKTSLVFTLLRASVYSVMVQQNEGDDDEGHNQENDISMAATSDY